MPFVVLEFLLTTSEAEEAPELTDEQSNKPTGKFVELCFFPASEAAHKALCQHQSVGKEEKQVGRPDDGHLGTIIR